MNSPGISVFHHESAARLIREGEINSAVQEGRFTLKKQGTYILQDLYKVGF
jgi:predicted NodU family carbamoyl transferase